MHKSIRILTIVAAMIVGAGQARAQDAISGLTYNTEGGYYEIPDATAFTAFANYLNSYNTGSDKTFKLTGDITYTYGDDDTQSNFTPMGMTAYPFGGTLDGQGHVISGIRIYQPSATYQGLFHTIVNGTVRDLVLSDVRITGDYYVGGIAGYIESGVIENCFVINTDITSTTTEFNPQKYKGVIAGNYYRTTGCSNNLYHDCTVNGKSTDVGAFSLDQEWASSGHTITLPSGVSAASGTTLKYNGITYHGSYKNTVTLTYANQPADKAALFTVTYADNSGVAAVTTGDFTMPKADVSVSAELRDICTLTLPDGVTASGRSITVGGEVRFLSGTTVSLGYASLSDGYAAFYSVNGTPIAGNTFEITGNTTVTVATSDVWGVTGGADGSSTEPYVITSPAGLDLLANKINGTGGYTQDFYAGKSFRQDADITYAHNTAWDDATSTENNFNPIGQKKYFRGIFDGDGHTISGIRIYRGGNDLYDNSDIGLFGGNYGTIKNVTISDARITGYSQVGGIVGYNGGTVSNCHAANTVAVHAVSDGAYKHGGIVGHNNSGTVSGCTSAATLTYADGLTVCNTIGAIAGIISGGTIEDCLAIGASVSGTGYVGAIIGFKISGTLRHNYYSGCTAGNATTNIGSGDNPSGDISSDAGAMPGDIFTVTLGEDMKASGTLNNTPMSSCYGGKFYTFAGQTVTLSYTGGAPEGKAFYTFSVKDADNGDIPVYYFGGQYTFAMPVKDVSASPVFKTFLTDVDYIDADGSLQTTDDNTKVYILDGTESWFGKDGEETWYVCNTAAAENDGKGLVYTGEQIFYGTHVHLILADGAAMTSEGRLCGNVSSFTIYGQSDDEDTMGKLTVTTDYASSISFKGITINSCIVEATSLNKHGIVSSTVTINGGRVKAFGYSGIQAGAVTINGGQVEANGATDYGIDVGMGTIILGWTRACDYIKASSYNSYVKTADGKRFVAYNDAEGPAASAILGSLTSATVIGDLTTIDGKYLRPLDGYVVKCKKRLTFSGKTDTDGKPKPDFTITSVSSAFATSYYIFKKDATVTVVATGHDDDYAEIDAIDIDETRPFYLNETAAKSHAFTMPGQDIKISSVRYYNLGVEYMNWDSGEPVVAKTDANTKVYVLDGTDGDLYAGWHVVKEDISYSDGLQLFGDVHIILADGATMTIGTEENPLYDLGMVAAGSYCPISIYGQSKGTGTLSISVSANETAIFSSDPINLYSCELIIPSCKDGISGHKIGIYGCDVTMTNVTKDGIYIGYGYDLILRASSLRIHSVGNGIGCVNNGKVFYYGGQVDITAGASGNGISGDVTLCSWTSASDYFKASSYVGTVTIGTGYYFTYEGHTGEPLTGTVSDLATIAGQKLIPAQKKVIDGETYIAYSSGNGNWVMNDPNVQVYVITGYNLKTGVVYLMPVASNEIPDGVPVIFGNKTDGSPLIDDFFLVGELTVSAGAEADYKKAIANFVAGDGQTTLQGFIDAIAGSADTPVSDYVAFILEDDRFKPIIMNASSTPSNGACLLILPKAALLTQAVVGSTSAARMLTIDLGGNATSISEKGIVNSEQDAWYSIDGRRLSGRPTAKGIYIHNGRAVVVQ